MAYPVMPLGFLGSQGDNDSYKIERSLRFNSADSAYLSRTPTSAGNRKTWTWSGWVKIGTLATSLNYPNLFGATSNNEFLIYSVTYPNCLGLLFDGGTSANIVTTQVFRDTSSWYHIVLQIDTTQATASNRVKFYVNGTQITSFQVSSYPSQNYESTFNSFQEQNIGSSPNARYFNGYLTEIHFIDGQALTPSSFGETDAITGRWKAKAYSGTYGTNGFYLNFADNSGTTSTTLGKDSSGNSNNWTPNNFSVTAGAGNDSLVDSPTNYGTDTGVGGEVRGNYATWNPLGPSGYVFSNGNLDVVGSSANNQNYPLSNFTAPSGKWYFECTSASMGTDPMVGISDIAKKYSIVYGKAGGIAKGDVITYTTLSTKSSFTGGDIIGIAVNADNSTVAFYKNNVLQDTINFSSALMVNTDWYAVCYSSSNPTTTWTINFGQRPFAYTAPSGFKALCTTNLPQPTIQKPSSAMDVVTYTGNGSARSITGLGFSPDLVWIKGRSGATDHAIYDSVRGVQKDLGSNLTTDETTQTQGLTAFNSDGFDIGTLAKINTNTSTYVAGAWDRAAIDGLDIVSYTGNGANRTIAHNLGVAPKMIIAKARTTAGTDQGWPVYHASNTAAPETDYLLLNSTAATADLDTVWNDTAPTASVFSVGTNALVNTNNDTYIAYLFAEVEGFSKFGSYTGNGSADGPFIYCGFRPRWIMTKIYSAGGAGYNWVMWDAARNPFNSASKVVFADLSNAEEETTTTIDILSNGFKLRNSGGTTNSNGSFYIFAAFAESPFKYARAR